MESNNNKEHRKDDIIESVIDGVDGLGDDLLDIELPDSLNGSDDLVEDEMMSINGEKLVDDGSESMDDLLSGILSGTGQHQGDLDVDIVDSVNVLSDAGAESIDDLLVNDSLGDVSGDLMQLHDDGDSHEVISNPVNTGDSHDSLVDIDPVDNLLVDKIESTDDILDDALLDDILLDDELGSTDGILDDALLDDILLDDELGSTDGSLDNALLDDSLLDDELGSTDVSLDDALLDDSLLDDASKTEVVDEASSQIIDDLLDDDSLDGGDDINHLFEEDLSDDDSLDGGDDINHLFEEDLSDDDSLDGGDDINHLFEEDLSDDDSLDGGDDINHLFEEDLSDDDSLDGGLPDFMDESPEFISDSDEEDVIEVSDDMLFEEVDSDIDLLDSFGKDDEKSVVQNIPHKEIDEVENLLDVISPKMTNKHVTEKSQQEHQVKIEDDQVVTQNPPETEGHDAQAQVVQAQVVQAQVAVEEMPIPNTPKKKKSVIKKMANVVFIAATLGSVAFGVWFGINEGYINIDNGGGSSSQMLEFSSELDAVKRSNDTLENRFSDLSQRFDAVSSQNNILKESNDNLVAGLTAHKEELYGLTRSFDSYRKDFDSKLERSMQATLNFMGTVNENTESMGEKVYSQTMARVREEFSDDSGVKLDDVYDKLTAYSSKLSLLESEVKGTKTLMSIYEGENEFVKRRLAEVSKKSGTRTYNKVSVVPPKKKLVKGIPSEKKDDAFCCIYVNGVTDEEYDAGNDQASKKIEQTKPEYLILGVFDQSRNPNNPHWSIYLKPADDRSSQGDMEYSVGDIVVGYGRILNVVSVKRGDGGIPYEVVTELGVIRNR
jgi:hypothetical protein